MENDEDPMKRWAAEGYRPELVRNSQGQWALEFGQDGTLVPEWTDWAGSPTWHSSKQEAIEAAAMDEKLAAEHRQAVERDKSTQNAKSPDV
jgi:hypothetical protein